MHYLFLLPFLLLYAVFAATLKAIAWMLTRLGGCPRTLY